MSPVGTEHVLATLAGVVAAVPHTNAPLALIVVVFGAALAAAWVMRALRAPTILGFLLAGVALGPSGLGLIGSDPHQQHVQFFADLGLVMLLFTVGLELAPGPLLRMGRGLLVAAVLQMGLTGLATAAALYWLVPLAGTGVLIVGLAASLSSTAIVLKHLNDRDQTGTPAGSLITGVLLIQDVVVILALVLLPLLGPAAPAQAHWLPYATRIGGALGGLVVVSLLARVAMPSLVHLVLRFGGQELMTLFAIVMACVGAWLASLADWSWPLGSFIAGLLLAQTDVRHQLRAEISPFHEAFSALFFVSIGMLADLNVFSRHPLALTFGIVAAVLAKAILSSGAAVLAGWSLRLALTAGLGLCTISEFGYVLTREAGRLQLIPSGFLPAFVVWTVGTMVLGALLLPVVEPLASAVVRRLRPDTRSLTRAAGPDEPASGKQNHVIIVGYGINGRNLGHVLRATGIPFTVVELNRANAHTARQDGADVIVGDAARLAILFRAGFEAARALVIAIADRDATRRIIAQAHRVRPDLYILARTRYVADLDTLYRLGARQVIPEEFETSIEIFAHVLREFAIPDNVIDQQINLIRASHYAMLRGRSTDRSLRAEWLRVLEAAATQTFLLTSDSAACGHTIRDLQLRTRTGVTVVAITRRGVPIPSPSPDLRLEDGDVLVLVGTHKQLDIARTALGPATTASKPVAESRRLEAGPQ